MSSTTPGYLHDAVALLPALPPFSGTAAEAFDRRGRERGIRFPDAVREWYSFDGAVDLLRHYSNADHPLPIEKFGEPLPNSYGGGPRDFLTQGLVVFMREPGRVQLGLQARRNRRSRSGCGGRTAPVTIGYTVPTSSAISSTARFGIIGRY